MKYSNEVLINLPVKRVVELFDNPVNMKKWMPGLVSFEHLEGKPGYPGAKSKLIYKMGNRNIEMIETIEVRNLPKEFTGTYEANGVWNRVRNTFIDEGNKTKYVSESEFKLKGFMKLMGWFMPGAFKKQSQNFLELFKKFAESEG